MGNLHTDVAIVGAGAAGTALALDLARRGVSFRWVDRLPGPATFSRAVTVHARTLELLDYIDPLLASRFLGRGIASPGYVLHYVDVAGMRRVVRPGLDFRPLASRHPFLLLHPQDETEATLRGWLRERYDREPEWGVRCEAVRQSSDSVELSLKHASGAIEVVQCRYLAACDGANSMVRSQVGMVQDGSDYTTMVLQNLDVPVFDLPEDDRWVQYCMGPSHFLMVAALPGGVHRLLMSQPADKADPEVAPASLFLSVLRQHYDGVRLGEARWHSRWASRVRLSHQYRAGRVFLAGDAAHVHSTAGGQGLNCCLHDAWNLGWKLAQVIRGEATETLLDSYERERRPIGSQVIAAASALHELFMAARQGAPEAFLALQASGAMERLIRQVSGLSYHYRSEEASGEVLQPGDRWPDEELGNSTIYEQTRHVGHSLVLALPAGTDAPSTWPPVAAPWLRLCRFDAAPPHLLPGNRAWLYGLRPDAYVSLSCSADDIGALHRWLQCRGVVPN